MRKGTSGQATVSVAVPPEEVYDTVSDVTRIPEWSPECAHARWVGDADGPVVGAKFVGVNRRGLLRWRTRPRVVAASRPSEFAFVMSFAPFGDLTRWTYEVEPGEDEGTSLVTERFEMVRDLPRALATVERTLMRVPDREKDLQQNIETSLERLREVLEGGGGRDGR